MEALNIKVAIIEDNKEMIDFLTQTIKNSDNLEFVVHYEHAEDAIRFLPQKTVDIVIVDIGLPGMNGIECIKQLKELLPSPQYMIFSVFEEDEKIFESIKVGANGYLKKGLKPQKVREAILDLYEGGSPMSPTIARKITEYFQRGHIKSKELEKLSKREIQILDLLSKGLLYKEIGEQLFITEGTVKQHNHSIYKKLQVQNKTEAINKYLGRN